MRIDSSGNVGIGQSTPTEKLSLGKGISYNADSALFTTIGVNDSAVNNNAVYRWRTGITGNATGHSLTFSTLGRTESSYTERMRIDGSGNLLVGTTDANLFDNTSGGGFSVGSNGITQIAKQGVDSADPVLLLNQTGLDGEILRFYKDGTAVGSIGNRFNAMYIHSPDGTNGSGLRLADGFIQPCESNGNDSDNDTDLGQVNSRFKDLYLSGGVKVGSYATELLDGGLKFKFNGGAFIDQNTVGQPLAFRVSNASSIDTTTMTLDSSGNLLVGTTALTPGNGNTDTGLLLKNDGRFFASSASNSQFNRNSDGDIVTFRQSGNLVGSIAAKDGDIALGTGDTGLRFLDGSDAITPHNISTNAGRDNAIDLGSLGARFDDIYATNGTIQTSDRNEKQDIEALTDAETRVAVAAKGLLRKFRWIDSVTEKGDEARIHFGIIAQDLQDAFTAEGLDAGDYAMFISSTWTDDDGVEQTRLGVRYSELLAFIIAAI
jgi:hypothetical protein